MFSGYFTETTGHHYSQCNLNYIIPFQFDILPETKMKVTKDTVTIKELKRWWRPKGQTVQLKDADPNELQLFIDKMPATIKGKSVKYD